MSVSNQLDQIIKGGNIDSNTALVIFAMELKQQRESIDDLNRHFDTKVATKTDKKELVEAIARNEKRVDRLEGFVIKILIGAASILVAGVIGATLVFK